MDKVYESLIALLIITSITIIILDYMIDLSKIRDLVYIMDFIVCALLGLDFIYRLLHSKNRQSFIRKYWYELLASIPAYIFLTLKIQFLGAILRSLRIIRTIRLVRFARVTLIFFRATKLVAIVNRLFIRSKMVYLLLLALIVITISSITVYVAEVDLENSSIRTFFDALWWSFSTVTTVGYGDKVPITFEGKLIGIILMIFGIMIWSGIISLLTATIMEMKYGERRGLKQELKYIVSKYINSSDLLTCEEKKILQKLLEIITEY